MSKEGYAALKMALEAATARFSRFYQPDEEQMETFVRAYEAFDYLMDSVTEGNPQLFFDVHDDDKTVTITLLLPDTIGAEAIPRDYAWVVEWATSVETAYTEDGMVWMRFDFPTLWEEIL